MEPQGRESDAPVRTRRRSGTLGLRKTTLESRVHVQTVGLNAKKIISALSQGKTFLLTFPFIGSLRAASGLRQSNLYSKPSAAIAGHSRGGDFCSIRNRASPPFKPFRQTIPQTCFILRRNGPEARRTKFLQLQLIRFWRTTGRVYPVCRLFSRSALRVSARHQYALCWGGLRGAGAGLGGWPPPGRAGAGWRSLRSALVWSLSRSLSRA